MQLWASLQQIRVSLNRFPNRQAKWLGCPVLFSWLSFLQWLISASQSLAVSAAGGGEPNISIQLSVSPTVPPFPLLDDWHHSASPRKQTDHRAWLWRNHGGTRQYLAATAQHLTLLSWRVGELPVSRVTMCPVSCRRQHMVWNTSHLGISSFRENPTVCFSNHKPLTNHFREVEGFTYLTKLTDLLIKTNERRLFSFPHYGQGDEGFSRFQICAWGCPW